ncbi:response regulator receiver protein [Thiohalobacter thiocyanaticus]|uniref:Response regulator receiver protein n=1 Tax=Thiohalobacter thiocyanaticus TaxID=585455 RepID=A0A1Z4VMA3_9GAMM|nr:LytTR family DNA-binding domain-containing protein [Thiohalobacter thiocyanaticus]BAZ92727.1 response regulator receiver protein [Thiohalobacter thiocyanaticus]
MKVLVVDDEALARERLISMLAGVPDIEITGEAATGREAIEQVAANRPDVVLLDIRMPEMDGLEAARHLAGLSEPPAVIFTTAYGDHALEAFEACAVDYLLKPIRNERLMAALANACRLNRAQAARIGDLPETRRRSHLCLPVRGGLQLVPVADIRYFQADNKYVTVRTGEGEFLIEEALKALEEEFGGDFIRIHRNALVARRHLSALERDAEGRLCAVLRGVDARLEVSRRQQPEVRRLLKGA